MQMLILFHFHSKPKNNPKVGMYILWMFWNLEAQRSNGTFMNFCSLSLHNILEYEWQMLKTINFSQKTLIRKDLVNCNTLSPVDVCKENHICCCFNNFYKIISIWNTWSVAFHTRLLLTKCVDTLHNSDISSNKWS